ncbi:tetratricopeptide repeat protein [Streptosporangium longisporum]|uniref:Tetratricopeptide repeat protein n=1 Tax=Streptosporangium longisporum TaxID=46187 RepID=A0ABP6LIA7_9ACTN
MEHDPFPVWGPERPGDTDPEAMPDDAARRADRERRLALALGRSDLLGAAERHRGALTASEEAVRIARRLTHDDRETYLPDLALCLANAAARYVRLGRRHEAVDAGREAVALRRELAVTRPGEHLPHLAGSLNALACDLSRIGMPEPALDAAREAVDLYRELAAGDPAYEPELAMALHTLAQRTASLERLEEAVTHSARAVSIRRRLAEEDPSACSATLATALHVLGCRLAALGRREEAADAYAEAVTIRQGLAGSPDARPADHDHLAAVAGEWADLLVEAGRLVEAVEALEIARTACLSAGDVERAERPATLPERPGGSRV